MKNKEKPIVRKNISFYDIEQDHLWLDAVRDQLSLSRSEVARRALRLGLAQLEKLTLPGSVQTDSQPGASE
jgi:hypothetical protein